MSVSRRRSIERLVSIQRSNIPNIVSSKDTDTTVVSSKNNNQNDSFWSDISEKLKENKLQDIQDLFELSPIEAMNILKISYMQYLKLIQHLSTAFVATKHRGTMLELYQQLMKRQRTKQYISTGCMKLNSLMQGGLRRGTIVEVAGAPGIGKTQFCLSCCVQVLNDDKGSNGVIYYDTEQKFDVQRLMQILGSVNPALAAESSNELNIHLKRPLSCKELLEDIEQLQSSIISLGISLIVVDSVAALARKEGLNEMDKEIYIVRQASICKKLAELCDCVILMTNQVTPSMRSHDNALNDIIIDSNNQEIRPALGVAWYHCVTTRIILCSPSINIQEQLAHSDEEVRVLKLTKSSHIALFENKFKIASFGIQLID